MTKNAEAIARILAEYAEAAEDARLTADRLQLAEFLASRGVLVPDALTWQQALTAVQGAGLFDIAHDGAGFTARLALGLENAAKGKL